MSQTERNKIIKEFRDGESRVLITTDLLSRGIDIQQISIVINYDIPKRLKIIFIVLVEKDMEEKGVAINFVTNYDKDKITHIEKLCYNY